MSPNVILDDLMWWDTPKSPPMNDHEIETIIQQAEKQVGSDSLTSARFMGVATAVPTPFLFLVHAPVVVIGTFWAVCWFVTGCLWVDGRKVKRDLMKARAQTLWQEMERIGAFDEKSSLKQRQFLKDIARIYERDPQGEILPLSQAIRLVLAWKQQQKRLNAIGAHLEQMRIARTTLQGKQKLLRELNDENVGVERALARLNDDIAPLERSYDILRASCTRLESLIVEVDASVRRRELHREVGELTARLSLGQKPEALELSSEHLDIERQIGREIETYLQLERETNVQLRDL